MFGNEHFGGSAVLSNVELISGFDSHDGFVFFKAVVQVVGGHATDVRDPFVGAVLRSASHFEFHGFPHRDHHGCERLRVDCSADNLRVDRILAQVG